MKSTKRWTFKKGEGEERMHRIIFLISFLFLFLPISRFNALEVVNGHLNVAQSGIGALQLVAGQTLLRKRQVEANQVITRRQVQGLPTRKRKGKKKKEKETRTHTE